MSVIPEDERTNEMRRLGFSPSFIQLACGNICHEAFEFRCKTPFYVYHGCRVPAGTLVLPLWDCGDVVYAVREMNTGLEFLEFGIEWVDEYEVIAQTQQGILAHLFVKLYEDECNRDGSADNALDEPANLVDFRYLSDLKKEYDAADHSTFESHESFVREFVSRIDHIELGG